MKIIKEERQASCIRFSVNEEGEELGHAWLYILRNDLHEAPFGFIEDVFIDEACRGKGYGTKLVEDMLAEAKRLHCYKAILTSRYTKPRVHTLYERAGFKDWGKEFRLDLI